MKAISSVRRTRKICEHRHTGSQHLAEYPPPRVPSRRGGSRGGRGGGSVLPLPKTNSRPVCCPHHAPPSSRTMTSTRTLAFAGRNYQPRRETIYIRFEVSREKNTFFSSTFLVAPRHAFLSLFSFSFFFSLSRKWVILLRNILSHQIHLFFFFFLE